MKPKGSRSRSSRSLGLLIGTLLTLAVAILFIYSLKVDTSFLSQVEMKTVDLRFRIRGTRPPDPRIVVAAIDQRSVDAIGRFPWPREIMADVIERLARAGAAVIALDVAFPLPQQTRIPEVLREESVSEEVIGRIARRLDHDRILARAVADAGNVILGYFFLTSKTEADALDPERSNAMAGLIDRDRFPVVLSPEGGVSNAVPEGYSVEATIPVLRDACRRVGFFNILADADGATRRKNLILRFGDGYYPSLELSVLLEAVPGENRLVVDDAGVSSFRVGSKTIPTDQAGRMFLNYRGPAGAYPRISVVDLLAGDPADGSLKNRFVFLGATAIGLFDTSVTPFTRQNFPGVEIHATALDNLLNNDALQSPSWLGPVNLALILVFGLGLSLLLPRVSPASGMIASLLLALVYALFVQTAFSSRGIVLNATFPLLGIIGVSVGVTALRVLIEVRAKTRIKQAFQHYLHPALVERIAENPELLRPGGERREVVVLFSDIRGFTTLCATHPPELTVSLLNDHLNRMTEIILENGGYVDKYIGDAIMAVWGAPLDHEDPAGAACRCAQAMIAALESMNNDRTSQNLPVFSIGIGMDMGEAVVGNIGSEKRLDYTVIGDRVNVAARLEKLNKDYDTRILASKQIMDKVQGKFRFRAMGEQILIPSLGPVAFGELEKTRIQT